MAFQPVTNTLSLRMIGEYGSALTDIVNTIHVRNLVGWSSGLASGMATTVGNAWRDNIVPQLASTYRFIRVEYADEGSEFGVVGAVSYNTLGGLGSTPLSPMVCAAVRLLTAGGPPRQGHLFISPLTEEVVSGDGVTGAYGTALLAGLNAILGILDEASQQWVVVSRFSKGAVPAPPHKRPEGLTANVASIQVYTRFFSQRDRRPEIGS